MPNYYDNIAKTVANAEGFVCADDEKPHFPSEGIFVGKLFGPKLEIPALIDLKERSSVCFLYNSPQTRASVNHCIERMAWRLATCLPPKQCQLILYNGGQPGAAFKFHLLVNDYLFKKNSPKVYIDGTVDKLGQRLDEVYDSILARMSTVSIANKGNLIELNESLGKEAKVPFQFIVLTDFPHGLDTRHMERLSQIVKAGAKAGIFVILSWDMTAKLEENRYAVNNFNPQSLLQEMEIIYPAGNKFMFRNSGHDEILNRFLFEMDGDEMIVEDAKRCASVIDRNVKEATKVEERGILKQDFETLKKDAYVPTDSEISVSIGVDIASKQTITLKFNTGDFIHAFILGQAGSGKSVLLNNIISSAILKYSPQDLVLYLMDFKGVEFNMYKGEKHTKAVLVDNSDPQMTLEVLRDLNEEHEKRVNLFIESGVKTIGAYNKKFPESRLPQVLFVVDECQVMFRTPRGGGVQMNIHREISAIIDNIATQGRSQGIHMLLATQQLDGADISGQVLTNISECLLLMCAPSDSNRLVPDSSDLTAIQATGLACYYHKKELKGQVQTFFASDDELKSAIQSAQKKASEIKGNGEAYFNGSALYSLSEDAVDLLTSSNNRYPTALVGKNIGLKGSITSIPMKDDFSENILFFGANKKDQTTGVLMNALVSIMVSCKSLGKPFDFLVIDCLTKADSKYKSLLAQLEKKGLCHLIERQRSGRTIKAIAKDILSGCASPVIMAIIGSERFIEMKRNLPLGADSTPNVVDGIEVLGFTNPFSPSPDADVDKMTFQQAFTYILDEGPMQNVHVLLQVDKPGNILFEGDYGVNATDKFRHKIILRSENKFLSPMRFSQDIDVETLSDEEKHLRAYYYPEGDDPVLFTPFTLPDISILDSDQ